MWKQSLELICMKRALDNSLYWSLIHDHESRYQWLMTKCTPGNWQLPMFPLLLAVWCVTSHHVVKIIHWIWSPWRNEMHSKKHCFDWSSLIWLIHLALDELGTGTPQRLPWATKWWKNDVRLSVRAYDYALLSGLSNNFMTGEEFDNILAWDHQLDEIIIKSKYITYCKHVIIRFSCAVWIPSIIQPSKGHTVCMHVTPHRLHRGNAYESNWSLWCTFTMHYSHVIEI